MAKKKNAASSSRGKSSAKAARGADGVLRTNDIVAEQGMATDDFVAGMPHNSIKELEHGHDNAVAPPTGETVEPDSDAVTASTMTEDTASEKTGGAADLGSNATIAPLDRVRVDASDQPLTTNQGVLIADNQNTLKAGLRGPSLLEDFILREKITHFDHERIPERIVHARGSGAHGFFEAYDTLTEYTRALWPRALAEGFSDIAVQNFPAARLGRCVAEYTRLQEAWSSLAEPVTR